MKPFTPRKILFCSMTLLGCLSIAATSARAAPRKQTPALSAASALKLYQQSRFRQAQELFARLVRAKPRDFSLLFYLGMSAARNSDPRTAESALSRIVVSTPYDNPFHVQAAKALATYYGLHPYSCLQVGVDPPKTARWHSSAMPLKIYISDGKQLPEKFYAKRLSCTEISEFARLSRNPRFVLDLPRARDYRSEMKNAVIHGLQEWSWAVRERLLNYSLVDDPTKADILVFWSPSLPGVTGLTYYPCAFNQPCFIQIALQSTDSNNIPRIAAHEFGHAWGLEHSSHHDDLMFGVPQDKTGKPPEGSSSATLPSRSDRATLRALYTIDPDIWFHTVSR